MKFLKLTIKLLLISFLLLPSLSFNSQATLVLKEPIYSDITETWIHTPLIYNNKYHNTSALWQEIDAFEQIAPEIIDIEVIGSSYYGKDIKSVRITNEFRRHQKAKTLVIGGHHGREQISVETALRFILHLLTGYGVDPVVTKAIDTQEIYVIPTINPDALDIVINEGNRMLRKNARPYNDDGDAYTDEDPLDDVNGDGIISWYMIYEKSGLDLIYLYYYLEGIDNDGDGKVNEDIVGHIDLNRNYDTYFRDGFGWSDDSLEGNYPGVSPFSEIETQTFRDFALFHRFAMAYSLHSGTNATYFVKNSNEYMESDIAYAMIEDFSSLRPTEWHFNDAFSNPPVPDPDYAAGIWEQWMYFERETLMPMTLELYGNASAQFIWNVTEIPIYENSTHVISEWKGINSFYNPEEQFLDNHWDDVAPFFPYLLENTPVLEVNTILHTSADSPGSLVNITFNCKNISPNLHSVQSVNVYDENINKIYEGTVIEADNSVQMNVILNLPNDFDGTYNIKIGNEYTGYYDYSLKAEESTESSIIEFSIIGLAILFVTIRNIILKRRKIK